MQINTQKPKATANTSPTHSSFFTPRNLIITAFVVALLLGAAAITLWQTGSASPEVIYALGGVGGALFLGALIATIITYVKINPETTPKSQISSRARDPILSKEKIIALIKTPKDDPDGIVKAIEASGTTHLKEYFKEALEIRHFRTCEALLKAFELETTYLCGLSLQYTKPSHSGIRIFLKNELGDRLTQVGKKDDDEALNALLDAMPEYLDDTAALGVLLEDDATKCIALFLSKYRKVIPESRMSSMFISERIANVPGRAEAFEALIDEHNKRIGASS